MKKTKMVLFSLLLGIIMISKVDAASISVKSTNTNVIVGNTFKVTVTVNGTGQEAGTVGAWKYCISYDSSLLALTSSTAGGDGICVMDGVVGVKSASTTFTFKAKASGTSTISLKDIEVYDFISEEVMNASSDSVKITTKTQAEVQASYSTNADLSELSVTDYEISPAFDKNTLEYSLEVNNDVERITINAKRADTSAQLIGTGEKELQEGLNKFELVVTAEKGNKKTYVINVTRKELNPITKNIDGMSYSVVRKMDGIEAPNYYALATTTFEGEEIEAFKSEITGYTLIALKDTEGNVELYRLDNNEIKSYLQLQTDAVTIIIEENNKVVEGYDKKEEIEINGEKVTGYVSDGNKEYVLVYGMNASTGAKGWYLYDKEEKTFQRYNEKLHSVSNKGNDLYFLLTIVFASISGLAIILVIILMVKNSKIREKNERLAEIVGNKKEKREQKIAERFDSFSDLADDELDALEETIKLQRELNATKEIEKTPEESEKEDTGEIDDPEKAIIENIAKANDKSFDSNDEIVEDGKIDETLEDDEEEKNEITDDINIEDIMETSNILIENDKKNKTEEKKDNEKEKIEEISFTQRLIEEPVSGNLSKREIRRLEKIRKLEEKEELKRMQEDFFSTNEYHLEEDEKEKIDETDKDEKGKNSDIEDTQMVSKKGRKKRK